MDGSGAFKQIIGYVDQFNRDVGRLAQAIEELMDDRGYGSLAAAGRKACWFVSSAIDRPTRWRMRHVARMLIPLGAKKTTHSLVYLILLETKSAFDFPTIICGRLQHAALTDHEIYSKVFSTALIKSLTYKRSSWRSFQEEGGWGVAEPSEAPSGSLQIQGYILNVFDIDTRQKVFDNIVRPLTEDVPDLDSVLTVNKYRFPELERQINPKGVEQ